MSALAGRRFLVTGGAGFLGSALVRGLLTAGSEVRVLDDESRGRSQRLAGLPVVLIPGDVRDAGTVSAAARGVDTVCHLAYVNGTEHFYSKPALVLDVAIRGMLAVTDACREHGTDLVLFSSSEVYQDPPSLPTAEDVPLSVPDPLNPRASYGGGKIACELLALHGEGLRRVVVVRPHNAYGPDMGREHAIPQITRTLCEAVFPRVRIQGDGSETRAYCFVSDVVEGVLLAIEHGVHRGVYHVGTEEETSTRDLVTGIAQCLGRDGVEVVPGPLHRGSPRRRCPDTTRLRDLGFQPRVTLREGLALTVPWYQEHP